MSYWQEKYLCGKPKYEVDSFLLICWAIGAFSIPALIDSASPIKWVITPIVISIFIALLRREQMTLILVGMMISLILGIGAMGTITTR
jgi:hypothetical protein